MEAPKVEKPKPVKKEKPVPVKTAESVDKDPLAVPGGIALGAAPLIAIPAVAAVLGRDTLVKTLERREKIQAEIAAAEAAKAKKAKDAEVDGSGLAKAGVSDNE